jgi:hypothetical protein
MMRCPSLPDNPDRFGQPGRWQSSRAPGGKTPWCARTETKALLEDSPSLRQKPDETIERDLDRALRLAASAFALYAETARVPLEPI